MPFPFIPIIAFFVASTTTATAVYTVCDARKKSREQKERDAAAKKSRSMDIHRAANSKPAKNTGKTPAASVPPQNGAPGSTVTTGVNTAVTDNSSTTADVKGTPTTPEQDVEAATKKLEETAGDADGSSANINDSDKLLKAIAAEISGAFERQEDLLLGVPYEYLSGSQAEGIESASEVISNTECNVDSISRIGFQKHPEKKAFMYITGPKGKMLHGEFILEHMGLGSQERSSVQETFSGNFMQIFGSRQKTLSISGGVYDAENFEWATKFEQLYDKRLKASCALKNGEKVYLYINKRVLECYMLSFNMTYSSQEDAMARFNMNIFVKSIKYDIEHDFSTPKPKKEAPPRKMAVTFAGNSTKIESKLKNFPDMIGDYDTRIRTAVNYASESVHRRMSQAFTKYGGTV